MGRSHVIQMLSNGKYIYNGRIGSHILATVIDIIQLTMDNFQASHTKFTPCRKYLDITFRYGACRNQNFGKLVMCHAGCWIEWNSSCLNLCLLESNECWPKLELHTHNTVVSADTRLWAAAHSPTGRFTIHAWIHASRSTLGRCLI